MKFEKITNPKAYRSKSCTNHFEISYLLLVEKLGEPFKNGEPDFPDDEDKVDVCWCFKYANGYISIWNYKNGPAYCGDEIQSLEEIDYFSFDYTDDDTLKAFFQQYDLPLTV